MDTKRVKMLAKTLAVLAVVGFVMASSPAFAGHGSGSHSSGSHGMHSSHSMHSMHSMHSSHSHSHSHKMHHSSFYHKNSFGWWGSYYPFLSYYPYFGSYYGSGYGCGYGLSSYGCGYGLSSYGCYSYPCAYSYPQVCQTFGCFGKSSFGFGSQHMKAGFPKFASMKSHK